MAQLDCSGLNMLTSSLTATAVRLQGLLHLLRITVRQLRQPGDKKELPAMRNLHRKGLVTRGRVWGTKCDVRLIQGVLRHGYGRWAVGQAGRLGKVDMAAGRQAGGQAGRQARPAGALAGRRQEGRQAGRRAGTRAGRRAGRRAGLV